MRRQRLGPLIPITAGIVIFFSFVIGITTILGGALAVGATLALLGHLWTVTWGPSSEPNRFHRRDLWENKRRVHKELRHRDLGHE
jgi:hypothetical protein